MTKNIKNDALVKFRESVDKSPEEMAVMLGVSLSFYTKVERVERNPSYNFVKKFKEKFPKANIDKIFFNHKLHVGCDFEPTGTG